MNSLTTSNLTQLQLAYVTRWADGEWVELWDSSLGVNPDQVPANLNLGITLRGLASQPEGSRNIPSRFVLQKPETNTGLMV